MRSRVLSPRLVKEVGVARAASFHAPEQYVGKVGAKFHRPVAQGRAVPAGERAERGRFCSARVSGSCGSWVEAV